MEKTPVQRAAIANLGCKVNQAEMDEVERLLRAGGVEMVGDNEAADVVVVNTCTVTSMADQKSRHAVRAARRASPNARLLVTGCSVAVDPSRFADADPDAELFDNESKSMLLAELEAMLRFEGAATGCEAALAAGDIGRKRAVIKIQDGCSFYCTYCIIPRARGPERSVPADTVIAEVRRAVAAGHHEVVLTGINAGTYSGVAEGGAERAFGAAGGAAAVSASTAVPDSPAVSASTAVPDSPAVPDAGAVPDAAAVPPAGVARPAAARPGPGAQPAPNLAALVGRILAETDVERIRLSSIEPQHVTDELLSVWAGSGGRCMPHFHVPLQSGDDAILHRMGRRYTTAEYAAVVARVRAGIPGAAVHADVIVGFPSEDDASFERTACFLRALEPAGVHVFRYSARPGTPAARMAGRVAEPDAKRRAAELLAIGAEARAAYATSLIGGELRVLFERALAGGRWLGHDERHVDVIASSPDGRSLENTVALVRAESIDPSAPGRLVGRLVP